MKVILRILWRIGVIRYNQDGSVRWPVHVAPRHVWACLWRGVWSPVGVFRNLPGIKRDCHSWLPRRWGFHLLGFEIGQRDEGWPENDGCRPEAACSTNGQCWRHSTWAEVNIYDDAHLGGTAEEEVGEEWLEEQEVSASFAALVKGWLERCTVTDEELAKAFNISRPSVARWRAGKCSAHPAMREHIRVFFAERLAAQTTPR